MIGPARHTRQSVRDFAKGNSGALIIGVCLIIGLNFEKLTTTVSEIPDAFRSVIYHLSGQAEAEQREFMAWREREEQTRAAQYEKQEKERAAQLERVKVLRAAWQAYLTAARTRFTQIKVVKNSSGGDYVCLQLSRKEEAAAYEVRGHRFR
jgi:hypothetical protein